MTLTARALLASAFVAAVFWAAADARAQGRTPRHTAERPAPRFEDYPAGEVYRGRPAPVRLDSKLLVLTESYYDSMGGYTAYYYLFDNNRFRLLRKAVERRPEPVEQN